MSITFAELENNLGKYLSLATIEDVFITVDGEVVAKLSGADSGDIQNIQNENRNRADIVNSLVGILPNDITLEESRNERLGLI